MTNTKNITLVSVLLAIGVVLSIFEANLIHIQALPGVKAGLSNIVCLVALYLSGTKTALLINALRAIFVGLMYSNPSSIVYSLTAAVVSVFCMSAVQKLLKNGVSCIGVSITGAFFHNLTQVVVCMIITENFNVIYYFSHLALLSVVTGAITGIAAYACINRLKKIG